MIRKGDYIKYRCLKANLLLHGPMGSGKTSAVREILGSDEKLERVDVFGELVLVRQSELFIGWRYTYESTMEMLREFVETVCGKVRYLVIYNVDDVPSSWYNGLNTLIEYVNRRRMLVLATCSSVSGLSCALVSRFLKVRVRGFTDEEIVEVCSARLGKTKEFIRRRYDGFGSILKGNMTLALFYLGMKSDKLQSNVVVGLLGSKEFDVRRMMEEPLELGFVLRVLSCKYNTNEDLECLSEISKLKYVTRDVQYHMIDKFIKMKENRDVVQKKSF